MNNYTRGTLRPHTDIENHKVTSDAYIDDLAKWFGRSVAIALLLWLVVWAVSKFV